MNVDKDSAIVAIVTDNRNSATHELLETLAQSSQFRLQFPHLKVLPDPLHQNVKSPQGIRELSEIFNRGYEVAVVSVGVPGRTDYEAKVHSVLDAWKMAQNKPVLSLISADPKLTQQYVDSWAGWDRTNSLNKNLVHASVQQIRIPADLAKEVHTCLEIKNKHFPRPSPIVYSPSITENKRNTPALAL